MTRHLLQVGGRRNTLLGCFTLLFLLFSLSFAFLVRADDHEDRVKAFQTAINYMQDKKGCLSIPYSDLQDACQRKQNEVNKWCKESGRWNCDDVDPKRTQKEIEQVKTERDTLKAQKEELERKKSSLTTDSDKRENEDKIKEIDNKLYELRRRQEDLEKQVSDATKMVNDRLYVGKACRDARPAVMEVFKDAKSRANSEHDADIAPLAKQLVTYWESEERGHDEQIRGAKDAVEKCDKVLYEIGHLGSF